MIHKYKLNGHNIVLDVGSGSVHVVNDLTYTILENIDENNIELEINEKSISALQSKYTIEEIRSAYNDIVDLYKSGSLFTSDDYSKFTYKLTNAPIKAMCLHVAHDCNLRCKYCFASTGDFEGTRCLMSYDIGKKAIDFLIENSDNRKNLELDFFGGEPLMNMEVVKQVVDYARSKEKQHGKKFRFTITTNGVLLDQDNIDFINKEMSNVVLSIDGRRHINDDMRPNLGGKGSYDQIVPKFQKLVESRGDKQYYARGTFTKNNLDFSEDVLHMYSLGFDQLSVEPVVSPASEPYALSEEDLPTIEREYEKLAIKMLEMEKEKKEFNFFHFAVDLTGGPCIIKRLRGCGCGNEYVAITPEGDIYPCHQFVGQDEWKMGNLNDGTFDLDIKEQFSKISIYSKEKCQKCWAKFYCSGGCNANSVQYCKDINEPHKISCELEKKRVECAIMMQIERFLVENSTHKMT